MFIHTLISSALRPSPPVLTIPQICSVIEGISTMQIVSPEMVSLLRDLSGIAYQDRNVPLYDARISFYHDTYRDARYKVLESLWTFCVSNSGGLCLSLFEDCLQAWSHENGHETLQTYFVMERLCRMRTFHHVEGLGEMMCHCLEKIIGALDPAKIHEIQQSDLATLADRLMK
jgi:hypothetical protein